MAWLPRVPAAGENTAVNSGATKSVNPISELRNVGDKATLSVESNKAKKLAWKASW